MSDDAVIHELGYRHYEGVYRSPAAVRRTLVSDGLRRAWLVGGTRRGRVVQGILVGVLVTPAVAMAAFQIATQSTEGGLTGANYLNSVSIVVVVLAALQANRLFADPFRHRTLALYLTRPITRWDYVSCRWLALGVSVAVTAAAPALVLLGAGTYLTGWASLPGALLRALVPVLVIAVQLSLVAALFASFGPRTGWGTALNVLYVLTTSTVASLLAGQDPEAVQPGAHGFALALVRGLNPFTASVALHQTGVPTGQRALTLGMVLVICVACVLLVERRHRRVV